MTDRELKIYALSGLLVRIKHEQDRINKVKDTEHREQIQNSIDKMIADYEELLKELRYNEY